VAANYPLCKPFINTSYHTPGHVGAVTRVISSLVVTCQVRLGVPAYAWITDMSHSLSSRPIKVSFHISSPSWPEEAAATQHWLLRSCVNEVLPVRLPSVSSDTNIYIALVCPCLVDTHVFCARPAAFAPCFPPACASSLYVYTAPLGMVFNALCSFAWIWVKSIFNPCVVWAVPWEVIGRTMGPIILNSHRVFVGV
jgi:hypothetical protein